MKSFLIVTRLPTYFLFFSFLYSNILLLYSLIFSFHILSFLYSNILLLYSLFFSFHFLYFLYSTILNLYSLLSIFQHSSFIYSLFFSFHILFFLYSSTLLLYSLFFSFNFLYFLYSTFTKGHIQLIFKFGNVPPFTTALPPSPWLFFSVLCRLCAEYTERILFLILSARGLTIKFITPRWLSISMFLTKIFKDLSSVIYQQSIV